MMFGIDFIMINFNQKVWSEFILVYTEYFMWCFLIQQLIAVGFGF